MTIWGHDAIRFLERVLPWPASPNDAGYGNIHWKMANTTGQGKEFFWPGKAFKSATEAWGFISWAYPRPETRDIYFCTSLQEKTALNAKGKEIAHRSQPSTLASKVIFLDVDVKPPPKGYATLNDALVAIHDFVRRWGLPKPTALVGSGGGVHCYWVSNKALTPAEWQPLANALRAAAVDFGLRCDGQCTVDITRILRPPETLNWKTTPPALTKLLKLADADLDFDAVGGVKHALMHVPALSTPPRLAQTPNSPSQGQTVIQTNLLFDPNVFAKRATPAAYAGVESGAAGLEPEANVDAKTVLHECPFLHEGIRTGGKHHDQPLWNLAVLTSTFIGNGRAVAHALSDQHKDYARADTDAMFDRKDHERKSRDMGYPSCVAIENAGSKECPLCPHRGKVRSPLNLKQAPVVTGTVSFLQQNTTGDLCPGYPRFPLPDGYVFDDNGVVCRVDIVKETDAAGNKEFVPALVPMFNKQQMLAPWIQENPDGINFEVTGSVGKIRRVSIAFEFLPSPADTLKILGRQGVRPYPQTMTQIGVFLMSLIRKMESMATTDPAKPFGWLADGTDENAPRNQFVFGGVTFHRNGTKKPGGYLDEEMQKIYGPRGKREPWIVAAKFITDQKRPEFSAFLATTLAAPLFQFSGQNLGVINGYGPTGGGKSTVLKIAAAFWGHPETSRLVKKATTNLVGHKMGIVSNLPVLWDELSDNNCHEALFDTMMQDGQERQRMVAKAGLLGVRVSGNWSTICASTSNPSFLDFISVKQPDNAAGRVRVFEWKMDRRDDSAVHRADVDKIIDTLRFNHGIVGLEYAEFLAKKSAELPALVMKRTKEFDKLVNATQDERFWSITCASLLLGAEFGNELGVTEFDLDEMRDFLVKTFKEQRKKRDDDGQEGADVAEELLTAFIKAHFENILITDGVPTKPGRQSQPINVLNMPRNPIEKPKGVYIQWIDRPVKPVLRISRLQLNNWLVAQKRQTSTIYDRIPHTITNGIKLGAGTNRVAGQERVVEIAITPGDWLHDVMCNIRGWNSNDEITEPVTEGVSDEALNKILTDAETARKKDDNR